MERSRDGRQTRVRPRTAAGTYWKRFARKANVYSLTQPKSSQFTTLGYNSPMARHERSDPTFLLTPNTLWKRWGVPNKEKPRAQV
ncbi:hypothetical protein GRJ2_002289900 [Grus japonensis]|uniref:Uncharacterized protein n=1 Tax=Grus japonensis TaxID=30415 RepID=A0ABC9XKM8_GRUJA